MFSPGNLRATFDNPNYERLISHYIGEKYTLRYTGGMVPDVFQIIVKEKGVFTNVTSPSTKAKLRILFEVAPLALLVRVPSLLLLFTDLTIAFARCVRNGATVSLTRMHLLALHFTSFPNSLGKKLRNSWHHLGTIQVGCP